MRSIDAEWEFGQSSLSSGERCIDRVRIMTSARIAVRARSYFAVVFYSVLSTRLSQFEAVSTVTASRKSANWLVAYRRDVLMSPAF